MTSESRPPPQPDSAHGVCPMVGIYPTCLSLWKTTLKSAEAAHACIITETGNSLFPKAAGLALGQYKLRKLFLSVEGNLSSQECLPMHLNWTLKMNCGRGFEIHRLLSESWKVVSICMKKTIFFPSVLKWLSSYSVIAGCKFHFSTLIHLRKKRRVWKQNMLATFQYFKFLSHVNAAKLTHLNFTSWNIKVH